MPKISIIIPNWNQFSLLATCLESLQTQTFREFETIVVDNGSTDGSPASVKNQFPWVRLIELETNTGFATANNIGLEHATGEYIVTLNNDTRAEPDWLEELVKPVENDPQIGMVGSRTCVWDSPDIIDTLGGRICRDGMSRGAFRGQSFSSLNLPDLVPILYPSPCAALYRRSMLDEVGFFDDDFFAYAEDTDLGLRARWMGWEAVAATNAIVHHLYSATGGSLSPMKVFLVERNHYWVAVKNFPISWLLFVPFWTLVRFAIQFKAVLAGQGTGEEFQSDVNRWSLLKATMKGQWEALVALPGMIRKRKGIMRRKQVDEIQMCRLFRQYGLSFHDLFDLSISLQIKGK